MALLQASLDRVRTSLQAELDKGSERDMESIALFEERGPKLLEEPKNNQQKPGVHRLGSYTL